jgi:hypothetical protein
VLLRLYLLVISLVLVSASVFGQKQLPPPKTRTPVTPGQTNPRPQGNIKKGVPGSKKGSRIIDDTTKQVYGPRTSKYFYEEDVFYNRNIIYLIDTAIRNFHRYNHAQRNGYAYQDLGTISTAIRPIFYQAPESIGVRSGFEGYDVYWSEDRIRYFDTKSPYSNMNLVLGGKGRSLTKASISRNVNPRWNVGIDFRGMFIDKQVPERRGKGDRITRSHNYDFYTTFQNKDSTYRLFTSYRRMFHQVNEPGGVQISNESIPLAEDDRYFSKTARTWLTAAHSNDLRSNIHIHHQFQVGKALQVYHTLDRYKQKARYQDDYSIDQDAFKYDPIIPGDSAWDWGKFKVVRNEIGAKGNLLKLFYNGYYALRHYNMTYSTVPQNVLPPNPKGDESYIGGRMELHLDSIGTINGWAEVNSDDNYRIEGNITSRWFEASVRQVLYKPSFVNQSYLGKHNYWQDNKFNNIESSQINGYLHYRSKVFNFSPGLTFTRLRNYVYYDSTSAVSQAERTQSVTPKQSSGNQIIASPEIRLSVTFFRRVTLSGRAIYTRLLENADEAIRLPELFTNSQLAYENIFFNGNLDMHAGVEAHWHSAYYALAYDPAIRQFYNQDYFQVNAFPIVDVFFNAKIKRGRIFVKYHNLVQAFTKTGYFPTPIYTGQRSIIDFGFDWSFYD